MKRGHNFLSVAFIQWYLLSTKYVVGIVLGAEETKETNPLI